MSKHDKCSGDGCQESLNGIYYIVESTNQEYCEDCAPPGAERMELING